MRCPPRRRWMILLPLILLAAGCAGAGGEGEPNDEIGQAHPVSLGEPFSLTLEPEGDRDWFALQVPGPGYLDLRAGDVPEEIGLEVAFAEHEKWEAAKENWLRGWQAPPTAVFLPEGGTVHLAVRDDFDDAASAEPIELLAEHLEPFDPHEPNDRPQDAKARELGTAFTAAIFPRGERDWFQVEAPGRGYLRAQTRKVPDEQLAIEASFARHDAWEGETRELAGWTAVPAAVFVDRAGPVHVALHDAFDDGRSRQTFEVRFQWIDDIDPHEPNDSRRDAGALAVDEPAAAALFPRGDVDHFRLELAEAGTYRLVARNLPDAASALHLEAALWRPDPEEAGRSVEVVGFTPLPADLPVDSPGTYRLVLRDDFNDAAAPEPFDLELTGPRGTSDAGSP